MNAPTEREVRFYMMQGIPVHLVERFWPFAEPYIKRALDRANGEFTPANLKRACLNRDIQLWLIGRDNRILGAGTTEIVIYPNKKHCRILTLAGTEFDHWATMANQMIEGWATAQGCDGLEAYVRKGFVPKLEQLGYKHKHTIVYKKLGGQS